jgi:hypothetical protein
LANTATYRSPGTIQSSGTTCAGTFGGATSCGGAGAGNVLDTQPANGLDNTIDRTNNDFTFIGPTGNYAGSDNVIYDAELVGDTATATQQIAESSLLNDASIATANSEIQSNTFLSWSVDVTNGTLALSFMADPDQLVSITDVGAGNLAQSNMNATFTLTANFGTGGSVSWSPQGTFGGATNDCVVTNLAGVTCTETADGADLNQAVSIGSVGSASNSYDVALILAQFGINVTGLPGGNYTLALNSVTSNTIVRATPTVPEPATLALLGVGILGMGFFARGKSKNA